MAMTNNESRDNAVSFLLVDKAKIRDFDIRNSICFKLEHAGLETVRDLRLKTPKEIRALTGLSLFDYLELYKYLHLNGVLSYQEADCPLINNVLSESIAKGIFLREIGLSETALYDLIEERVFCHTKYKPLLEDEIKSALDDNLFITENRRLIYQNPGEYHRREAKVSSYICEIKNNKPYYTSLGLYSRGIDRDTYEEVLMRMRESGLFSMEDDNYFEEYGDKKIGVAFKDIKLVLDYHRNQIYNSHFDNKCFALFSSYGELFPSECSFPSTIVTVGDLMRLNSQDIKKCLPKEKNRDDQYISKFYCKLLQCGIINHNETLRKCQELHNTFDRVMYSCVKAIDNKAIEDFSLPQGIITSLINCQIYSFGELRAMDESDLLNIYGIGRQKVAVIRRFITSVLNGIGCQDDFQL